MLATRDEEASKILMMLGERSMIVGRMLGISENENVEAPSRAPRLVCPAQPERKQLLCFVGLCFVGLCFVGLLGCSCCGAVVDWYAALYPDAVSHGSV